METIFMHKGEIWLVNLDPALGAEIQKKRPAVIVSDDAIGVLPLRVVVPLTEWKDRYAIAAWMVRLEPDTENGLEKPSAADAFQLRSVSTQRLIRQVGSVSVDALAEIIQAIQIVIGGA
jgi:mRNA interferase MazF